MAGNGRSPGASVASRVLALLGAFDGEHRSMTLTVLAKRADLPLATAFRLVNELVEWGALTRRTTGEYVVGRRLWDLGLLSPVQSGLRQVASPFLHDLYGATLATVHLAVRDGTSALYVDRLAGHVSVPVVSDVGSRLPLYATGVGKVLLAHAPDDVRAWVFTNLNRITPYTITQPGRLRAELRRVLRDGFAQTSEEMSLGACSVAVPIRVAGGPVVAALGMVVPSLGRSRPRLVAALQVAAQGIGRSLPLGESD
ncbi:IclR family transcriptional regulator [Actinophytocola oryzae]|uniref:IclR family transcriptional regulator n=1 Tax=Actinophytocola oryzae TaxID=502181 RepID=A0A4R7VZ04_9PSEU|nr:IclR family transcriptional regulator [Actinophytocola oryzae]TDV55416.1 IclR family transcriptional regulator [Actinophytocola oryzae]